jgi:hypothetical protein
MQKNILNFLIVVIISFIPSLSFGQFNIYKTVEEFENKKPFRVSKEIQFMMFSKKVKLYDYRGKSEKIHRDSLWGYSHEKKGNIKYFRISQGRSFEIEVIHDKIIMYKFVNKTVTSVNSWVLPDKAISYFFSKTLYSDLKKITADNLRNAYKFNNRQNKKLIELSKERKLNKKNIETNVFFIIEELFGAF